MTTATLETPAPSVPVVTVPALNTKPIAFGVADKRIAELSSMYLPLVVKSIDDAAGLKVVHDARITIKTHRVDIEKTRKALKEDALRYGQAVDAEAKRLTALLAPIEEHLEAEENRILAEKKRLKEEEEQRVHAIVLDRMNKLLAVGCASLNYAQVKELTAPDFAKTLAEATESHRIAQEKAAAELAEKQRQEQAERERLAAERKEQERLRAEEDARRAEEAKRLAAERAELEKQKAEADAKAAAERAELEKQRQAQQAEAERIAAERRKLEEQQAEQRRQEELRKAQAEAAEKARIEAEQRAKREDEEAKARAEAQEAERLRLEALRPDREKLLAFADQLAGIECPDVTKASAALRGKVVKIVAAAVSQVREAVRSAIAE